MTIPDSDVGTLFSLAGRVAVVTGAASGLGQAMAYGLAQAGAHVVCADRDAQALPAVVTAIGVDHAEACTVDVADRHAVEDLATDVVDRLGRIDVLVNSAGVGGRGVAEDYPDELWERVLAINLTGTFLCCQAFGRRMLAARSGAIVNIASVGGLVGYAGSVGYQASKGGVVQITRTLAVEWASRGIRVNAIAPSQFDTPVVRRQWAREPEMAGIFTSRTPLGRIGDARDIVGPVVFLASDASAMVTGHILAVDGGYTAQ